MIGFEGLKGRQQFWFNHDQNYKDFSTTIFFNKDDNIYIWICIYFTIQSSRDAFAKHACFPLSFLSEHPKEVSLTSFLQNRIKCFQNVMTKIVLTEPAEEILRFIRNTHLWNTRYWLLWCVAREKTTERTVASENKINMFGNLNGL